MKTKRMFVLVTRKLLLDRVISQSIFPVGLPSLLVASGPRESHWPELGGALCFAVSVARTPALIRSFAGSVVTQQQRHTG